MSERPHEPLLSVVVCTHERRDDLERCLEGMSRLEDPPEVIVVDSASRPPCEDVVARYRDSVPDLHYVYEPKPGLSAARNRGAVAARGRIVAFVDDDAVPEPDWARRIVRPFLEQPQVGCVGGTCTPDFAGPRPRWLSDVLLCFAGISNFGDEAHEVGSGEWPYGANMAFRREALTACSSFRDELGRTGRQLQSGDDSTMVRQVRDRGWTIWIEPPAVVHHRVSRERLTARYYWRRLWWEGRSHARISRTWRRPIGLAIEAPCYLVRWARTRDRAYLYRATAETLGHFAEWATWGVRAVVGPRARSA